MRPEALYLTDIVEAADAIAGFLKDATKEAFLASDLFRSAVLQKLSMIGEAAARVNRKFKNDHPLVPWAEIVAFRNFAVHAYFDVEWPIVWDTATEEVPVLKAQVADILRAEFPDVS